MSTGGFCSHGLEGCCSELSSCFSVAAVVAATVAGLGGGQRALGTEYKIQQLEFPWSCSLQSCWVMNLCNWSRLVLPGVCAARTAINREVLFIVSHLQRCKAESLTGILVCALKQGDDF